MNLPKCFKCFLEINSCWKKNKNCDTKTVRQNSAASVHHRKKLENDEILTSMCQKHIQ